MGYHPFNPSKVFFWHLVLGLLASQQPALADPVNGVTDNCKEGGTIIERNFFGIDKDFTVHITNKDNGGQEVKRIPAGIIPAGQSVSVTVPPPGPGIEHCDAFNTSVAVAGGGGGGPGDVKEGARQQLKIEVLFANQNTNEIILGSIFDFMDQAYAGRFLNLPDLWGDTNGDGVIGAGDYLYSLVDIYEYTNGGADDLNQVNARYIAGQSFSILNGEVVELPGFLFSNTEFIFDPVNGYQGTPYSGTGFAVTNHEIAVPGPLPVLGAVAAFGYSRKLRRRIESNRIL